MIINKFAEPMISRTLVPAPGGMFIALPGVFYLSKSVKNCSKRMSVYSSIIFRIVEDEIPSAKYCVREKETNVKLNFNINIAIIS